MTPTRVEGSSRSITFHEEEQAIEGGCHTKPEPTMAEKSTHCAGMKQTGKETDQEHHDNEDMDPYSCFVMEEQPMKQAYDTDASNKADDDMEDYMCFVIEEHPSSLHHA